jgi:hypothetical protein
VRNSEVRFALNNGRRQPDLLGPKSARKRLVHCNKLHRYSITSARPSSDSGRRGRSTAPLPLLPRAAMEPAGMRAGVDRRGEMR